MAGVAGRRFPAQVRGGVSPCERLETHPFPLPQGLPLALLSLALAIGANQGMGLAVAVLGGWLVVRAASVALGREQLDLSWRDLLLVPGVDLWRFLVLILSFLPIPVRWDGQTLRVGREGRIVGVVEHRRAALARSGSAPALTESLSDRG